MSDETSLRFKMCFKNDCIIDEGKDDELMGGLYSDFSQRLKMIYSGDILRKNCSPTQAHPGRLTMICAILKLPGVRPGTGQDARGRHFESRIIMHFGANHCAILLLNKPVVDNTP